ncbi:MAG: hypothetical protein COU10_00690 [Candidatus Harrisonbacteria bacterium CG10_big_fil_rev_8_21_14_0_10_45_28]|uniref:Cell shape-determining protein MreC n=1 Tax=Candidatus Harrisonbacteria bacterium CG10_big_fil_rev_8_21_14_0_10_45_28 TaxID=1974586 RepID=A0A2H0UP29_9BACT|nr:MAG: hypothetical protein COU10_00690 [Candidatus Harrisonbacteria bacterium CG10_big_fil_rev_8_21_14_0_10_45_28]
MQRNSKAKNILAVLVIVFLVGQLFFVPKTYVNSRIVTALQAPFIFIRSILARENITHQLVGLQLENQDLRAQIEILRNRPAVIKDGGITMILAKVYSNYPVNNANKILVHAGTDSGLEIGAVATTGEGIFLGEVVEVFDKISVVRTIFDPDWELPVKIGASRVDALLVSGILPKLTLISKNKTVSVGAPIYLADKNYPYGLTIGTVSEVVASENERFDSALLSTPYEKSGLDAIYIRLSN